MSYARSENAPVFGNIAVSVASNDALDVREFSVEERLSSLFEVRLVVLSGNPDIAFDEIVGQRARFVVHTGRQVRTWSGICSQLEQVAVDERGLSTYHLTLVPTLWLLTQRRNYRIFQQISEPDAVLRLLSEWKIEPEIRFGRGAHKQRKYRVQYAESDFAFMCRMLEDAGISFYFEEAAEESRLVLTDAPERAEPRAAGLPFIDKPSAADEADREHVTALQVAQRVRPGRYTLRDQDHRLSPRYSLLASAVIPRGGVEEKLERFHYVPGAFLFKTERGESTPVADDKGKTRTDEAEGSALAEKRLGAKRGNRKVCLFDTNAHDLSPGTVMTIVNHPRSDLGEDRPLLVVASTLCGTSYGEWKHTCEAWSAEVAYRPTLRTRKPKIAGVESATVVGPAGEEIHCDEFGRVRVHFHWDRESKMDDDSSCWIPVSQSWAGSGFGGMNLPRVGQEVLVDFLGGDPDRPVIVGRVYTNLQRVPYKLPEHKTRSTWRSSSSPGGDGFNELTFEDAKGRELVYVQAERNLEKLVKVDETITVGHDRTTAVWSVDASTIGVKHSVQIRGTPTGTEMVAGRISLTTGAATITLDGPNVTIEAEAGITLTAGSDIVIHAAANVIVHGAANVAVDAGASLSVTSGADAVVQAGGGDLVLQGGPMVQINPG